MNRIILTALIFCSSHLYGATDKKVKSNIKNVTVFTQGAQVFRTATVTLTPGVTNLIIGGLSEQINPASVQAGGKGNFIVLDVKHHIEYPKPEEPKESKLSPAVLREIALLEDSATELSFNAAELIEKQNALLLEKDMIVKNKLSRGEGKSDSLAVLKQAMELFRLKLNDINDQLARIKRQQYKNTITTNRINERLSNLRTYKEKEEPKESYKPEHQVVISVSADEATTGVLEINYMVAGAGWTPSYDLRSSTAMAPMQLTYKANVFQSTGEEWNDVKLKLSTSNPNKGNIKPELPVWYINYFTQRPAALYKGAREQSVLNSVVAGQDNTEAKKDLDDLSPAQSAANYSQLVETMTNVEFDIKLDYTIPSDGSSHMVSIKKSDLPAQYYHYLVPKLDSEAFLLAKITGWEDLNLLPGPANVFYEGTYVGATVLNPSVINDTLQLALGRDNGIVITRTKMPVKENNKLLGNEITKTIAYELKLKNNKSRLINLVVEDQIPISQNKDIKVELKDKGKADYNDGTGGLKWTLSVDPKESKSLKFAYAVTFNKDMPLSLY